MQAAQRLADERRNPQTTPEHLLAVLLEQDGGVVAPVLRKLGAEPAAVRQILGPRLDALPKLTGEPDRVPPPSRPAGRPSSSRSCAPPRPRCASCSDEYVSTEHLLLALAAHPGGAGEALRSSGAPRDALLKALGEVRGSHRVTDDSPEDKFQRPGEVRPRSHRGRRRRASSTR